MYGYIYLTTNLVNGKKYIGQHTAKDFSSDYYGSGILLKKAIKKYGKNNFKVELLIPINGVNTICESKEELNNAEIYYINLFNCISDDQYYNVASGGEGGNQGPLCNARIKEACKGVNTWSKGRIKIHKGNIEKSIYPLDLTDYLDNGWEKGRKIMTKSKKPKSKKTPEEYAIIAQKAKISRDKTLAARTDEQRRIISKHISESRKNSLNLNIWNRGMKAEEWMTPDHLLKFKASIKQPKSEEHKKKISQTRINSGIAKGKNNPKAKKVICVDTNQIFSYAGEAESILKIPAKHIRSCCQGYRKTAGGLVFKYIEKDKSTDDN